MALPSFVIIGAQKAGSTFVQECFREHPQVFIPLDEIPYFGMPDYEQTKFSEFEKIFDEARPGQVIGMKRPKYLLQKGCAERIHAHIHDSKIIAVLRNPVDRAVSAYYHYMAHDFIPVQSIETGIRRILRGGFARRYARASEIIEFGFYARGLQSYLKLFPRKQIHLIRFKDIKTKAAEVIRRLYLLLGVDDKYKPRALRSRPQAVIYSMSRLHWMRLINKLQYRYNQSRTRLYAKNLGPFGLFLKQKMYSVDRRILAPVLQNPRPSLSKSLKKLLVCVYENDIRRLEKITGWNLSEWLLYA
ncbi:MAG: sulfotransferase domain-containing protein [Planctomycetota bacterium]|jgi:hypothetical protein